MSGVSSVSVGIGLRSGQAAAGVVGATPGRVLTYPLVGLARNCRCQCLREARSFHLGPQLRIAE